MKIIPLYCIVALFLLSTSCVKPVAEQQKPAVEEPVPIDSLGSPIVVEPKDPYPDFITYTIQKGKNYCESNDFEVLSGIRKIAFQVIFDSSCIYTNALAENQADINKLMGFSDCATLHQVNSARFGWNWMDGQLHLYAYCYNNKERMYKSLGTVGLDSIHHCSLSVSAHSYIFEVNGKSDTMSRHCDDNVIQGYRLLPYFGGDEPAPQTIKIRIKYL